MLDYTRWRSSGVYVRRVSTALCAPRTVRSKVCVCWNSFPREVWRTSNYSLARRAAPLASPTVWGLLWSARRHISAQIRTVRHSPLPPMPNSGFEGSCISPARTSDVPYRSRRRAARAVARQPAINRVELCPRSGHKCSSSTARLQTGPKTAMCESTLTTALTQTHGRSLSPVQCHVG